MSERGEVWREGRGGRGLGGGAHGERETVTRGETRNRYVDLVSHIHMLARFTQNKISSTYALLKTQVILFGAPAAFLPSFFLFKKKSKNTQVILFGVPAAFSPSCSDKHLPSYLEKFCELKAAGKKDL